MDVEGPEIRSSARRTRTMTAFREGGRLVVVVPARMSRRQRQEMVPGLVERFLAKEARGRPPRGEEALTARTLELYRRWVAPHADGPEPQVGVRWVPGMTTRWASCTRSTGEIRVSERVRGLPAWVVDHVLLHEAVHLLESGHSDRFWRIVDAHPDSVRAKGFLDGVAHAWANPAGTDA